MAKTEWTGGQKREGVLSEDLSENPLRSDTLIQFPYCTADLYVGTHRVNYKSHSLNHLGRKNLERAFAVLEAEGLLTGRVKRFLAYGRSAGALGLLLNMDLLNAYIDGEAQKVVIIDAPGAQFAPKVWEQFDDLFFRDIRSAFFRNGSDIERGETKLSSKFQEICQTYPHWRMGFLQGSRDTVMSLLFGKILPYQFEEQVLSEVGLFGLLQDPNDECSSWTPRSRTHGFLSRLQGLHKRTEDRLSALEYLDQLLDPEALQRSHR